MTCSLAKAYRTSGIRWSRDHDSVFQCHLEVQPMESGSRVWWVVTVCRDQSDTALQLEHAWFWLIARIDRS